MLKANTPCTECLKTAQCAPLKHHYDECAERVQQQIDDNGAAEENCVEECEYPCRALSGLDLCHAAVGMVPRHVSADDDL